MDPVKKILGKLDREEKEHNKKYPRQWSKWDREKGYDYDEDD